MTRSQWVAAVTVRWISRAVYGFFGGFTVHGLENIPPRGRLILAANHVSLADPLMVVAAVPRVMRYMTGHDIHEVPILGRSLLYLGSSPVRRDGASDPSAMAVARTWLRRGDTVVIFPEGRCSPDGRLQPLQPGVAVLALREQAPIVPIVLAGTREMLPLGARWPSFHHKHVRIGLPIYPEPVASGVSVKEQVARCLERLSAAMLGLGAPA